MWEHRKGNGCVFSNWEMWDLHSENMLTAALWLLGCPDWLSLQHDRQLPCPLWPFWEPRLTCLLQRIKSPAQSVIYKKKKGRQASLPAFVKGQDGRSKVCDHITASKSKLTKLFNFLACFIIKESGGRLFLLDTESKYLQNDFVECINGGCYYFRNT